jgi:hypothetical protein
MKRLKSFDELNEKFKFTGTCDGPLCAIIPSLEKLGDLVDHQDTPQDLLKMQAETNKILKMINDEIKATINARPHDGVDWTKAPLAPVFILNLVKKYPQDEEKYHAAWFKAVTRMADKFSYGGAINIFKAYAKRDEFQLMLEDHDYDNDLSEEQINDMLA